MFFVSHNRSQLYKKCFMQRVNCAKTYNQHLPLRKHDLHRNQSVNPTISWRNRVAIPRRFFLLKFPKKHNLLSTQKYFLFSKSRHFLQVSEISRHRYPTTSNAAFLLFYTFEPIKHHLPFTVWELSSQKTVKKRGGRILYLSLPVRHIISDGKWVKDERRWRQWRELEVNTHFFAPWAN